MSLYGKLSTTERRAVMRIMRGLAYGEYNKGDLPRICKTVRRSAPRLNEKKRTSGYLEFYKTVFPTLRDGNSEMSLPQIARKAGEMWKELKDEEKEMYNDRASKSRLNK